MERDEHEMLVEYSEMTAFNFNSKEFKKVRDDYVECKNVISSINNAVSELINNIRIAQSC